MSVTLRRQSDTFLGLKEITPARKPRRRSSSTTVTSGWVSRPKNVSTVRSLMYHAQQIQDEPVKQVILKKADTIRQCGSWTGYTELSSGKYLSQGKFRCKEAFCPHCQIVRSKRLTSAFDKFFRANHEVAQRYHLYHATLTVPHSPETELYQGMYAARLQEDFNWLRGGKVSRAQARWWDTSIIGGAYFVQTTCKQAYSLHTHLHCLLIATRDLQAASALDGASFEEQLRGNWTHRTGANERGIHLERIYWQEDGQKHHYIPSSGQSNEEFMLAVKGCTSYITQGNKPEVLQTVNSCLVQELILQSGRAYNRIGCLNANSNQQIFKSLNLLNCKEDGDNQTSAGGHRKRIALPEHIANQVPLDTDGTGSQIPDELLANAYVFAAADSHPVASSVATAPPDAIALTGPATHQAPPTQPTQGRACFSFIKWKTLLQDAPNRVTCEQLFICINQLILLHPIRGPSVGIAVPAHKGASMLNTQLTNFYLSNFSLVGVVIENDCPCKTLHSPFHAHDTEDEPAYRDYSR